MIGALELFGACFASLALGQARSRTKSTYRTLCMALTVIYFNKASLDRAEALLILDKVLLQD